MSTSEKYTGFESILSEIDDNITENSSDENTNDTFVSETKGINVLDIENILAEEQNNIFGKMTNAKQKNSGTPQEQPFYTGHRQRAKQRFLASPTSASDYDLLELLLFLIIPRADTKPLAKKMVDMFKNIQGVFKATQNELKDCGLNAPNMEYILTLIKEINRRAIAEKMQNQAISLDKKDILIEFCKTLFVGLKEEQFFVILLDNQLKLIDVKPFSSSQVANVNINIREICKFAINKYAKNIVITHNHPNSDCHPSKDDILTTDKIKETLQTIDVNLIDHIIISCNGHYSFAESIFN